MSFEKAPSYVEVTPKAGCVGCSNAGQQVYSGYYSSQQATNAGRCSA